jgi:hypothetical protein
LEIKILNNWNKEHQILLDKICSLIELPNETQIQKIKFKLLSELLLKLCTSRNIKSNFKNITSLILLLLNMYKTNYPLDGYTTGTKEIQLKKQEDQQLKHILKQELF